MNFKKKSELQKEIDSISKATIAVKAIAHIVKWFIKSIIFILNFISFPVLLIFFFLMLFMMILPSANLSAGAGLDGLYEDDTVVSPVDDYWEQDANAALQARYNQLIHTPFWDGLVNFFSTGSWNNPNVETFKTEYADADDLDSNGESIAKGYFSTSNRLIAVINQAFITSKNDAMTNNNIFFESPSLRRAKKLAHSMANDRSNTSIYMQLKNSYPLVPDSNISIKIEKENNDNKDFIQQSCYALAAGSSRANKNETHDSVTKDILDTVFQFTGIDIPLEDMTTPIVWKPQVTWEHQYREEQKSRLVEVWNPHKTLLAPAGSYVDLDGDGIKEYHKEDVWEGGYDYIEEFYTEYYLDILFKYSLALDENYEKVIDYHMGVEDTLPPDAASYELTEKEIVELNAMQLAQFYGDFVGELGAVGLPLPEYSYTLGHPFKCMCSVHAPKGHSGQDLPAANNTSVFSIADGEVILVQTGHSNNTGSSGMAAYGNCVFIKHEDENGNLYFSRYAHLNAVTVRVGDKVVAGDIIGAVGNTGNSFGNHLHFEMLKDQNTASHRIDPMNTPVGDLLRQYRRT